MANITDVKLPDNSQYDLKDNVSGYASKVSSATTDDLASLTATGDLADSGKKISDLVLKSDVKNVLDSTSTTDPLSANQGRVLNENVEAIFDVYGAKNCIDPFTADVANAVNNHGTFSNIVADSYPYFYMYVQAWDGATFKGNLANAGITQAGEYSYPITIPSGTKTLQIMHNGGTYDIRTIFECNVEGDFIISFRVIGADASTIGGLSFNTVMLRDARVTDDTWVPYAPTNRELMSFKANGKVGAKNLLNMDEYSKPLTHTKAGDSYTFPVLSDIRDRIYQFTDTDMNGIFTVVFSSSGTNVRPAIEIFNSSDTKVADMITDPVTSSGLSVSLPFNNGCKIRVTYFDGGGEPITFTDTMIRIVEDTDPNYQPYAKTNKQLTADKAERADLATLNLTGSTNTTGAQIDAGTFFYLNGQFCKALVNIAVNATFTLNTNYEEVTVGGELNDKVSLSTQIQSNINLDDLPTGFWRIGGGLTNAPSSEMWGSCISFNVTGGLQIATRYQGDMYIRYENSGWSAWKVIQQS